MNKQDLNIQFIEIAGLIRTARFRALRGVNRELINLYWNIGEHVSKKVNSEKWGKGVIQKLADYLEKVLPDPRSFSASNIWRMKQFYETYKGNNKLEPLIRELSWTNNCMILARTKTAEEREFYLRLASGERYSKRDLKRQIDSCFYERTMSSKSKILAPLARELQQLNITGFKDTYILDFLDLPKDFKESDLRDSIVKNLQKFLLEFGKDFSLIGKEYRLQVGNNDYFIDLLFYHRELKCLVAIELKTDEFKPEYLGKLNFYLEALDRELKKAHENPSVGIILCKNKDREVVEYALSRNLSPAMISEYKTKLLDKHILQRKLHELFQLSEKCEY